MKATFQDCLLEDSVAYPLDIPTYNKLRPTDFAVPRILVVVLINETFENWTLHSENELKLFRCGYWVSLAGEPEVTNTHTKTTVKVELPVSNWPIMRIRQEW